MRTTESRSRYMEYRLPGDCIALNDGAQEIPAPYYAPDLPSSGDGSGGRNLKRPTGTFIAKNYLAQSGNETLF